MSKIISSGNEYKEMELEYNEDAVNAFVPNEPKISEIGRVFGIIISPIKTLEDIRIKPSYLFPILFLIFLPPIFYLLAWGPYSQAYLELLHNQYEAMGMADVMNGETMRIAQMTSMISMVVGSAVGLIISSLISSVYYLVVSKIAKSEVNFSQLFSMALHINIIGILAVVVNAVFALVTGSAAIMNGPTTLAGLVPGILENPLLYGITSWIELFNIWSLVLVYFGMKHVAKVKSGVAIITVVLLLLFSMASGAVGSLMTASSGLF